jgi:hypothetical protein
MSIGTLMTLIEWIYTDFEKLKLFRSLRCCFWSVYSMEIPEFDWNTELLLFWGAVACGYGIAPLPYSHLRIILLEVKKVILCYRSE